jgi:hypothetical protein
LHVRAGTLRFTIREFQAENVTMYLFAQCKKYHRIGWMAAAQIYHPSRLVASESGSENIGTLGEDTVMITI